MLLLPDSVSDRMDMILSSNIPKRLLVGVTKRGKIGGGGVVSLVLVRVLVETHSLIDCCIT